VYALERGVVAPEVRVFALAAGGVALDKGVFALETGVFAAETGVVW